MRVPECQDLSVLGPCQPLVEAGGLVPEQVLVDLPRRAVDEMDRDPVDVESQVERQAAHEVLRRPVGVGEGPVHGTLPELAVVLVHVRAAAILHVPGDRVVVVAVDRGNRAFLDQRADLIGMGAITDEVTTAIDALDSQLVDPPEGRLQGRKVGVNVGDHGDGLRHMLEAIY